MFHGQALTYRISFFCSINYNFSFVLKLDHLKIMRSFQLHNTELSKINQLVKKQKKRYVLLSLLLLLLLFLKLEKKENITGFNASEMNMKI